MKSILNQLFALENLSQQEAYQLMTRIGAGEVNDAHMAALLTVYLMRPLTLPELTGFQQALLDLCIPFSPDCPVIDLCGTGGDSKNTFNISTLSSFIVAAAGYKVAKHGNYGVSSASGSSNVMENFGYRFTNNTDDLARQLEQNNICFLHAPLFHPALKHVGQVRRQMGLKTFFNMLGPLVNPAKPAYRVTGVFSLELARLYHYLLQQGKGTYTVLHSIDGFDEISLTGPVKVYSRHREDLLSPQELGFDTLTEAQLFGGNSAVEASVIFKEVIEGRGTVAQQQVVLANAAVAIQCLEPGLDFETCRAKATEALLSGKAAQTFRNTIA